MKKDYPRYTLRIPNEILFKLSFVSDFYGRSKNREIEFIIKQHIDEFESKYGIIPVPERFQDLEKEKSQSKKKPKTHKFIFLHIKNSFIKR